MVVIYDVDGTLANGDHREHHIKKDPPDWATFCSPALMAKDSSFESAKRVVRKLQELKYLPIVLTGRNEGLRDTTMRWLLEHYELSVPDERLIMRPIGNMLTPSAYKRDKVEEIVRTYGRDALLFIDDDKYMHGIYSQYGIALYAPACWDVMFPDHGELPVEEAWRK